jgi:cytochrome P450
MATSALPPGPRAPRLLQAVRWGLRYPQFTGSAGRRFGATYTLKPGTMEPFVVTSDGDAIKRLLTGDPLAKRHGNDAVRPLLDDRSVMLLDPSEHIARRKLLLPAFHGERVQGYAQLMEELMEREVAGWKPGDTVAVLPIAQNVTIEVILQAVLGVADEETRRRFRQLIDNILFYPFGALRLRITARLAGRLRTPRKLREAGAFAAALPTPAVMTYFPGMKSRSWRNAATLPWWRHIDRLHALLDEHVAATRADPKLAERTDVLAMLVQVRDEDGIGLSDEDLRQDLVALIAAGHETTAAAISWGAVFLADDPALLERATTAVEEGDERWLGALVKEILRVRPPTLVGAGRKLDEPFVIGAHTIPPKTLILIDAWGVHHDPARHADPDRFDPERFLTDAPESYSWVPFGGGAHRCIGSALAEQEIRIALETILRRVTIAAVEDEPPFPVRRGIVMVPHGGARIRITGSRA